MLEQKNIYIQLANLIQKKEPCVLATVTFSQGSTPQKPGSAAIIGKKGLLAGTIGGGKVEHTVVQAARDALGSKISGYFHFELNDDIQANDSVICGGTMHVLIDASPEKHLRTFLELKNSQDNHLAGVLVTLSTENASENINLERYWITKENISTKGSTIDPQILSKVKNMLSHGSSDICLEMVLQGAPKSGNLYAFLEHIKPKARLLIAGAGHVGKALSHLASLIDFEVTVWDDRSEFANEMNLPEANEILTGDPLTAFNSIRPDYNTYIVIVTRGHSQDTRVLKYFMRSAAGYIGMIGSKKKIADVRRLSLQEGWATDADWKRIHAPVGIDIHSKTVQEIAVSIAAELIQERHLLNNQNK